MDPLRAMIHLGLKMTETTLDRTLDVVRLVDTVLVASAVPTERDATSDEPVWPQEEQADLDALSATLRARKEPASSAAKKAPAKKSPATKSAALPGPAKKASTKKASATKAPAKKSAARPGSAKKASTAATKKNASTKPAAKKAAAKKTSAKTAQTATKTSKAPGLVVHPDA